MKKLFFRKYMTFFQSEFFLFFKFELESRPGSHRILYYHKSASLVLFTLRLFHRILWILTLKYIITKTKDISLVSLKSILSLSLGFLFCFLLQFVVFIIFYYNHLNLESTKNTRNATFLRKQRTALLNTTYFRSFTTAFFCQVLFRNEHFKIKISVTTFWKLETQWKRTSFLYKGNVASSLDRS